MQIKTQVLDELSVSLKAAERAQTLLRHANSEDGIRCLVFDVEDAILKARRLIAAADIGERP